MLSGPKHYNILSRSVIRNHDANSRVFAALQRFSKSKKTFIGHTRLKTHGDQFQNENNQPIKYNNLSIVHNGIIVNYEKLLKEFNLSPRSQLDSEVILLLLGHFLDKDNLESALKQTIKKLSGEASIAGTLNKGESYFLYTK